MKLSIIIPAYNEEKRILKTLEEYNNFFKNLLKNNFEIIVIPNNCNDNTLKIVQDFAKKNSHLRIFNISGYSGKGGAVMKGFELAKGDFIGFTDADNSTNPENFFKLYKNIKKFDGIIASRRIKGAIISPKRKLSQELSSLMFNKIVNLLFNLKYYDTQCGAKLFTKKTTRLLIKNYRENGWIFDVDLLVICRKNNKKILEYPIQWKDNEGSKLTFLDGIKSVIGVFKYKLGII